jgi:hypothetical protein
MNTVVIHSWVLLIIFGAGYVGWMFSETIWSLIERTLDLVTDYLTRREYIRLTYDWTPCPMAPGDFLSTLPQEKRDAIFRGERVEITRDEISAFREKIFESEHLEQCDSIDELGTGKIFYPPCDPD